ncbi:DUF3857 domain-containing protein [Mucilaginibacter robiniae]|uniref:DUF3857 domain-containing protein n=1 Tax=Mucilaginibacter robiniae TaxID=2728022 RepID=A0A7L5DZC8_9SPHI|nr:DUF3857 domain-containing protein [Mucilaginibacter robiniae]QJD96462.1 DUF3857 domain-containing protein [Mucilaginibacter robiniae]
MVALTTQPYGKIDKADLALTECSFEKGANAMVLFDKGDIYYDNDFNIIVEHHKRIKIFNEAGKKQADIRLEYYGGNRFEYITDLQGEIFNLNNGNIENTKLDKKQLYTQVVDKNKMAIVFSFANVKPGSVIEYKYRQTINSFYAIPIWYFQEEIPVRYSELKTSIPEMLVFTKQQRVYSPLTKYITSTESRSIGGGSNPYQFIENVEIRATANVHSLTEEPYMRSAADNRQSLHFQLTHVMPQGGFTQSYSDSWDKVGGILADDEDFGLQLRHKLQNEEAIVSKAKALKTNEEKIAYVFNEVKNDVKWNGSDDWYTNEGTAKAWEKKTGNSAEVNLILYHLLKQSGVKAYPMVVSTRSHGAVNPAFTFLYQFNRAVVYIPVDSIKHYVLDATNKYNSYREVPDNLLNSAGLYIDKENKKYNMVFLQRSEPAKQAIYVNAEISPEGKMTGIAQISNSSYNRYHNIERYKTDGEKKYIDNLRNNDNNFSITSLKMLNMEVDSLPLNQDVNFSLDISGSDKDYMYFKPDLFSGLRTNPFISETRACDIDFGYCNDYAIAATYKVPAGYKVDALPKSISIVMPNQSIVFRRVMAEEDGVISVRYIVNYKKSQFFKEDYPDFRAFNKKMHELLDEQIVLKKS